MPLEILMTVILLMGCSISIWGCLKLLIALSDTTRLKIFISIGLFLIELSVAWFILFR